METVHRTSISFRELDWETKVRSIETLRTYVVSTFLETPPRKDGKEIFEPYGLDCFCKKRDNIKFNVINAKKTNEYFIKIMHDMIADHTPMHKCP